MGCVADKTKQTRELFGNILDYVKLNRPWICILENVANLQQRYKRTFVLVLVARLFGATPRTSKIHTNLSDTMHLGSILTLPILEFFVPTAHLFDCDLFWTQVPIV